MLISRQLFRLVLLAALLLYSGICTAQVSLPRGIEIDDISGDYIIKLYDSRTGKLNLYHYEPSTKIHPFVEVDIKYNSKADIFTYEYIVRNGINSQQAIIAFALEITREFHITNSNTAIVNNYDGISISWIYDMRGDYDSSDGIKPGQKLKGFKIYSQDAPSIVSCYFMGQSKNSKLPIQLPKDIRLYLDSQSSFPENAVQRLTIGPSDDFRKINFISSINKLLQISEKAYNQGWVTKVRVFTQIDKYLQEAKQYKESDNSINAFKKLNQLLKYLKDQAKDWMEPGLYQLYIHHVKTLSTKI